MVLFGALAMLGAAVKPESSLYGIAAGQVQRADRTAHHVLWRCTRGLGRGRGVSPCGLVAAKCAALATPPEEGDAQHDRDEQVLHSARPRMTSITKREPT